MNLIYSKENPKKLLHIIFKVKDFDNIDIGSRKNVVDPNQFIQMSAIKLKKIKHLNLIRIFGKKEKKKLLHKNHGLLLKDL